MKYPFKETKKENKLIREFNQNVNPDELEWHQDDEDREIISVKETDWMIQLDNELPKSLNEKIFIHRHRWHRLIKGSGNCIVEVNKF